MANTTNFGWETPDDTDLVKDGAAAMRTLGNSIDASFVDLKGGTTGQVLAKASNTDLDFVWSADAAGISPTIFDARGDIIAASAADTAARLAVGANGTVLTADSAEATGLKWAAPATGSMTLLESGTLSGASVTTGTLSGSYTDLEIRIFNYKPATNGDGMSLRLNGDSGSNYAGMKPYSSWSSTSLINATSLGEIVPKTWNSGTQNGITVAKIYNYSKTTVWKSANSLYSLTLADGAASPTEYKVGGQGMGLWLNTAAVTTLTFFAVSGNMTSGTYEIYGVK